MLYNVVKDKKKRFVWLSCFLIITLIKLKPILYVNSKGI